nr:1,2-phenylacetyl-CoA epoxidase subunit PaaD [Halocatena marina]
MMPDHESDEPEYCAYTEYDRGKSVAELPNTGENASGLERDVWNALFEVEDPEMPISVVDLGLIYGVDIDDDYATVEMTLTYTGCPARKMLLSDVRKAATSVDGIEESDVRLVWSPEWSVEFVTDAGKNDLREFGVSI